MIYEITSRAGISYRVSDAPTAALILIGDAKAECHANIVAVYPALWQLNAANGLKTEAEVAAMRAHILACKAIEDAYTASVEAILAGAGSDADKIAAVAAL